MDDDGRGPHLEEGEEAVCAGSRAQERERERDSASCALGRTRYVNYPLEDDHTNMFLSRDYSKSKKKHSEESLSL